MSDYCDRISRWTWRVGFRNVPWDQVTEKQAETIVPGMIDSWQGNRATYRGSMPSKGQLSPYPWGLKPGSPVFGLYERRWLMEDIEKMERVLAVGDLLPLWRREMMTAILRDLKRRLKAGE